MKLTPVSPLKSLSKAYLKQSLRREQVELFKANLARMFERIRTDEHEEHLKNIVSDFLKDSWYIAPNKFMRAGYGKNTRELLTTQARPLMVLDFGDLPIFDEATTYPSIVMVEKTPLVGAGSKPALDRKQKSGRVMDPPLHESDFFTATFTATKQLTSFDETLAAIGFTMPVSALSPDGWTLEPPEVLHLMQKLRSVGKPLGEYVNGKVFYGIKTSLNEAFVIDAATRGRLIAADPNSAQVIKPWLRGRDIKKWRAEWAGLYVIAIASSANQEWPWSQAKSEAEALPLFKRAYPAIYRHLEQFADGLRKRDDQGRFFWELRSCAYYGEFEKEKILWPGISSEFVFGYDGSGSYGNDNNQLIISSNMFLLAFLNSCLIRFVLHHICDKVQGGFYRMKMIYIQQLPIPDVPPEKQAPIVALVEQILAAKNVGAPLAAPAFTDHNDRARQAAPLHNPPADVPVLEAEIDHLVYALYGLTEDEIAVVEDKQ